MDCPRCGSDLKLQNHKGIEVDRCGSCEGMWLDYPELDQLEDNVLEEDEQKGTMITRAMASELKCPKCQGPMSQFRYRYNELWLDVCEAEHGFWLDKGEEKRVFDLMGERIGDLKRSSSAEMDWARLLGRVRSKGIVDRVKGMLRGRR